LARDNFIREAIAELISEEISRSDLEKLEKVLDALFAKVGMDIEFTKHFHDRVNDDRNGRDITVQELQVLFAKTYRKHAPDLSKKKDIEAVLKDVQTAINIPFVLKWNSSKKEVELVSKTVMRKKNFKSPDRTYAV